MLYCSSFFNRTGCDNISKALLRSKKQQLWICCSLALLILHWVVPLLHFHMSDYWHIDYCKWGYSLQDAYRLFYVLIFLGFYSGWLVVRSDNNYLINTFLCFLYNRTVSVSFIVSGKIPSFIDLLNTILSGSASSNLRLFSRILFILSYPALFYLVVQ